MAEGRRRSVDVPISRALVALRRVRSLRDPSTNSMSKFSSVFDSLDAEIGLSNEHFGFDDGDREYRMENLQMSVGDRLKESACNMFGNCKNPALMESTFKDLSLTGGAKAPLSGSDGGEGLNFRYSSHCSEDEMVKKCFTPATNRAEDVDSCNEPSVDAMREMGVNYRVRRWRDPYGSVYQSSLKGGDGASRVGVSSYMDGDSSDADCDFQGCGLSYCWSRTPRLKSDPPSDVDDQPLLSGEIGDTAICMQNGKWAVSDNELTPCDGSPSNLSLKFRPKTFSDLVGQNVIIRSLSLAISARRPSSLYLFHGPRGTGKTTTSRIFAASLNCASQDEQNPCGSCYHCSSFFSGNSRDVTFVDSVMISERKRIGHLMNSAIRPPQSSAFRIIVFDECQLLRKDAWMTILNRLDSLPQHVVLVMITPDLEKLPQSVLSQSQRFRFQKIKDPDISARLKKICFAEGFDFEQAALDFIAAKSSGSLRDAEMMLEQLSLPGKTISMSLAYEVTGIISEDELLELLDVALSPNTSNTVLMAREMMKSRIDPMQLTSQLANVIMDVLSGKFQDDNSEVRRKFLKNHSSEADFRMLSHALKILSETEKQLRASKNQSTWLTAALLQFSSLEPISDPNDSRVLMSPVGPLNGEFCSTPSAEESLRHLVPCECNDSSSDKVNNTERLELIWSRAIEACQSSSLGRFLRKQGRLSSVAATQGVVVAKLEFWHRKHVTRAENAWKLIASALKTTLGCNVEIQINLAVGSHAMKSEKLIKGCLKFLSCGRTNQQKSFSTTVHSSGLSVSSDLTSERTLIGDKLVESCKLDSGQQVPHSGCCGTNTTIRDSQGNALRIECVKPNDASSDAVPFISPSKEIVTVKTEVGELEVQPKCFERGMKLHNKLIKSRKSQLSGLPENKKGSLSFFACGKDADAFICNGADNAAEYDNIEVSRKKSKIGCWKSPSVLSKAWNSSMHRREGKHSMWVLPCTADK